MADKQVRREGGVRKRLSGAGSIAQLGMLLSMSSNV